MKKRLLFVDDDPMVLQGLERMLRTHRGEWEMEFAPGGVEALARLDARPPDIVVADMRMPGMNGAELLEAVRQRHPETLRLILSGYADRELMMQCLGAAHQYLAKPCSPEALAAAIRRLSALDGTLKKDALRRLVAELKSLPSVPGIYSELVETANRPDATLEDLSAIISRDVGISARILQLANSAFFGLHQKVSTLDEAIAYIGFETIRALVVSVHAFSQYEHVRMGGYTLEALWAHSLLVGDSARAIARCETNDRKIANQAFVAGLLHDVGKVVLAANLPDQYRDTVRTAREQQVDLTVIEERNLGATHADVGGYLLGLWGLPAAVVDAIAMHHQPERAGTDAFSPVTAVHAANAFANADHSPEPVVPSGGMDMEYLAHLGLEDRVETWREQCRT